MSGNRIIGVDQEKPARTAERTKKMKRVFLASAGSFVAGDVAERMAGERGLKLLYVTTAAEAEDGDLWWLRADRDALATAGFLVFEYTITGKSREEIARAFDDANVLCFSGGNNYYLLEKIQQTGCADLIRRAVENGKPYFGISAGAIVAGPDLSPLYYEPDARKAPELKGLKGLALVDFIVFPHWGNPYFKDFYMNQRLVQAFTPGHKIILLTDSQYVYVEDDAFRIIETKE
jgi:dipeptidase E